MMETYIRRGHNSVVQYIATLQLMDLCKATERKQGAQVGMQYWEQAGIDLAGYSETSATAAQADKGGMKE